MNQNQNQNQNFQSLPGNLPQNHQDFICLPAIEAATGINDAEDDEDDEWHTTLRYDSSVGVQGPQLQT